ncbi:MAG TPA: hypothetical protein VEB59_09000 [Gemmatimonadales bacterium]|nr:hypothetical protein [Gemmatimonadales bacterium]
MASILVSGLLVGILPESPLGLGLKVFALVGCWVLAWSYVLYWVAQWAVRTFGPLERDLHDESLGEEPPRLLDPGDRWLL